MKNLMSVTIVLFSVTLLLNPMFGQQRVRNESGNLGAPRINWVDANGDGLCDNIGTDLQGLKTSNGKMYKGLNRGAGKIVLVLEKEMVTVHLMGLHRYKKVVDEELTDKLILIW